MITNTERLPYSEFRYHLDLDEGELLTIQQGLEEYQERVLEDLTKSVRREGEWGTEDVQFLTVQLSRIDQMIEQIKAMTRSC